MIHTGGHAAGHAAYLDRHNRILFTGDNICSDVSGCGGAGKPRTNGPHSECTLLTYYRDRMQYLVERLDEYDYIFPQHFMNNLESHLMVDILETVNRILDDPDSYDYKKETYGKARDSVNVRYFKYIRGFSVIGYSK